MTAYNNVTQMVNVHKDMYNIIPNGYIKVGCLYNVYDDDIPIPSRGGLSHYRTEPSYGNNGGWWYNATKQCLARSSSIQTLEDETVVISGLFRMSGDDPSWTRILVYLDGITLSQITYYYSSRWKYTLTRTTFWYESYFNSEELKLQECMLYEISTTHFATDELRDYSNEELTSYALNKNPTYVGEPSYYDKTSSNHSFAYYVNRSDALGASDFIYNHNELRAYLRFKETKVLPPFYSSGLSSAYVDAVNDLPQAFMNNIANAMEIVGYIMTIVMAITRSDPFKAVEGLEDARNIYLLWRYCFCTTSSDIEEMSDLFKRLKELEQQSCITAKGTYRQGDVLFRVTLKLSTYDFFSPTAEGGLREFGLIPNVTKSWDLVPFSFMVDWFVHLSDWLDWYEKFYDNSIQLAISEVWGSYETSYSDQTIYARFPMAHSNLSGSMPAATPRAVSGKTLFMRLTDVLTIFSP